MKKYLDQNIDRNGWIISKAVFTPKNKPYGVVAFFIDKSPIYTAIRKSMDDSVRYGKFAAIGAAAISLFISLLIFIRYMMIARGAAKSAMLSPSRPDAEYESHGSDAANSSHIRVTPLYGESASTRRSSVGPNTKILDAIPVNKRKGR